MTHKPVHEPRSLNQVSDLVREANVSVVHGIGLDVGRFGLPTAYRAARGRAVRMDLPDTVGADGSMCRISLAGYEGIVDWNVSDQVVRVRAGTRLAALNRELSSQGQCIPWSPVLPESDKWTLGVELQMNLPHALEGLCGSWRDWVLGTTVVRADGVIAKCGSRAVKNVAGYDVQKLFIGDRGTLGVVVEVTLRTFPLGALPKPALEARGTLAESAICIQRVQRSDLDQAIEAAGRVKVIDPPTATLWCDLGPDESQTRFPGDWIVRAGAGLRNLETTDPAQIRLMKRAKEIFDPANKLNPAEMGIF